MRSRARFATRASNQPARPITGAVDGARLLLDVVLDRVAAA
ncbi:hypothetical protein [Burkholderia multivorans]